jgi:hypothetical protein
MQIVSQQGEATRGYGHEPETEVATGNVTYERPYMHYLVRRSLVCD